MSEQPKALRLAAALQWPFNNQATQQDAAAELRRLYEENQKLLEALKPALENICAAKLCEFNSMSSRHEMIRLMDAAITAIREAMAEQPAPVAKTHKQQSAERGEPVPSIIQILGHCPECGAKAHHFTSPPAIKPWVGLTEEDIGRCFDAADGTMGSLIAAIEANLREKNA